MERTGLSFCQRVVAVAAIRPNKVAMTMLHQNGFEDITFKAMLEQIRCVAYRLGQEGVAFGERVAIIGENHPNWALAYLGILYRGAVVTPLDPAATIRTLATFLGDSETKLAFVSPASLDKFRDACAQLGQAIPVVLLQPLEKNEESVHVNACISDWTSTLPPSEFVIAPPPAGPEDLALLMYTSGTTGRPKAVPLTHGNIQAQIDAVQEVMKVTDRESVLSILPLFHAYSQIVNLWLAVTIGARVVYLNQFGSAEIEAGLKRCGATALTGVPRLWYLFHKKVFDSVNAKPVPLRWAFKTMLLANGVLRDYVHINVGRIFFRPIHRAFGSKMRLAVSGGATFDHEVAKDFHRLGFTLLQGYGLTETSGAVTVTRFEDNIIGSVGTPLNGVEVKIDDANEAGVGEVLIRGPIVTAGYYRNPEANNEAFTPDRWFRSGDLGYLDRKGHLYIVGRKKDVIILPSGKNVFPEDVEAHYERSPLVNEICVLGKRDATNQFKGAESLCAIVVPNFEFMKTQHITNPGEWIPWELEDLGRELPEYQRVHDFIVRTEPLPRTTTHKICRHELQQQLEAMEMSGLSKRNGNQFILNSTERGLMNSLAGSMVTAIIKGHVTDVPFIHPRLSLEIDLRLDSLARVECITNVEQVLGIQFKPEETTSILTVGDLVKLVSRKTGDEGSTLSSTGRDIATNVVSITSKSYWQEALNDTSTIIPELQPLLIRKRVTVFLAYLLLRLIYFGARVLLGMEVKGSIILKQLKPPYLICPNHQSYIDPFLLCSILPPSVLKHILHVGASRYFAGFATSQLARLINIVPIDPDIHLLRAMQTGAAALREGKILNVYPEGRRSFDGQLGIFKKGAAILATELNVPIVPVAIDGTYRIWPRGSVRIRLAKVKISFGQPIEACKVISNNNNDEEKYEVVTALIEERISKMLEEMRER
jgi:long-chain acyl-CoA synthetase